MIRELRKHAWSWLASRGRLSRRVLERWGLAVARRGLDEIGVDTSHRGPDIELDPMVFRDALHVALRRFEAGLIDASIGRMHDGALAWVVTLRTSDDRVRTAMVGLGAGTRPMSVVALGRVLVGLTPVMID